MAGPDSELAAAGFQGRSPCFAGIRSQGGASWDHHVVDSWQSGVEPPAKHFYLNSSPVGRINAPVPKQTTRNPTSNLGKAARARQTADKVSSTCRASSDRSHFSDRMDADTLIRTLRAYDASFDATALQKALDDGQSAEILDWATRYITPDTLLSVDELNQ
jgi:hypothetical protein